MASPDRNFFGKLKEFKRIPLRADKTDQSFAAMIHLAAAVINSRSIQTDPSSDLQSSDATLTRPSRIAFTKAR